MLMTKEETGVVTEYLAKIFKLLGDPNRLKILFSLAHEAKSVSEIMNETELPQTLVSFHLKTLRNANILRAERNATFIYYSLSDQRIMECISAFLLLDGLEIRTEDRKQGFNGICNPQQMMSLMKGAFKL